MSSGRRAVVFLAIVVVSAVADQGTKAWARTLPVRPAQCSVDDMTAHRCAGVPQPVIAGYWDWELAYNDGGAFSSLRGHAILLSLIAMAALIGLGVMAARTAPEQGLRRGALALIAGGALGNLTDRLRDGAVVDFVRWRIGDTRWPIFNVADVVLVAGACLLILETVLARRRPAPA